MRFELNSKTFPVIDASVCHRCSKKPCHEFSGGYVYSVIVGYGDAPPNCPLLIPIYESPSKHSIFFSHLKRGDVIRAVEDTGRVYNYQSLPQTSVLELIEVLYHARMIMILVSRYGSPAHTAIVGWQSAKNASFHKAIAEEKKARAAEIEKAKPKPALMNPEWVSLAIPKNKGSEETVLTEAALKEYLWCKVESESLMPGDSVTFTLYLKGREGAPDERLLMIQGGVAEGRSDDSALAGWKVSDEVSGKILTPFQSEIYFIAKQQSHNLEVNSRMLKIAPQLGDCAEVHDGLFDHNSALMALSPVGDKDAFHGLNILAEAIVYSNSHHDRECVIYGHADTTGDASYNLEISKLRAESVKALLDGNKNAWVNIALKKGSVESLEKYLFAFHHAIGWDCDPGIVDDKMSAATHSAIRNFQSAFNAEHEGNLQVTGEINSETWGAIYHVIAEQLGMLIEAKGLNPKTVKMNYTSKDGGVVGCGEKYPLEAKEKDGFKSQKNRRVEIAFVDSGKGMPRTRKEIRFEPIDIKASERKVKPKASVTSIEYWCGHEDGKRKAKNGEVLEIVASALHGDTITMKANGSGAKDLVWEAPGLFDGKKTGAEIKFTVHGFRGNPTTWWFPDFLPKKYTLNVKTEEGKELKCSIWNYPNDERTVEIDPMKYGKLIVDTIRKIPWALNDENEKGFRFEFFNGKISGKVGFKEDNVPEKFPTKVIFNSSLEGGFSPLISCKTPKMEYPTLLKILPNSVRKYIADIKAYLEMAGEIGCMFSYALQSNEGSKRKISATGGIKISIGLFAQVGASKVLKVDGKGTTGFSIEASPKDQENSSVEFIIEIQPKWNGITASIIFDLWDGTVSFSREVPLVDAYDFKKQQWTLMGKDA